MLEQNKEKVKLVFKHYPLKSHAFAMDSASAAEVAGKTGKFWEFHDRLFQESDKLSNEKILDIAVELGFDPAEFEIKMNDPAILNRIQADINDGVLGGRPGSPEGFYQWPTAKRTYPGWVSENDQCGTGKDCPSTQGGKAIVCAVNLKKTASP